MNFQDDYFLCDNCDQIEPKSRWNKGSTGLLKCIHCDAEGTNGTWPTPEVGKLIEFILNYDQESPEYGQVTSVFLSSVLELMLEELLSTMAYFDLTYDEAGILVDALIEGYQGRTRMFTLYKTIGYGTFHEAVRDIGIPEFTNHWDEIAPVRNEVVHGKFEKGKDITPKLINTTIDEALAVFSQLHNIYNQESLIFRAATEKKRRMEEDLKKLNKWTTAIQGSDFSNNE